VAGIAAGGRRAAGGKEQEGVPVLVGGGGGESPVDEHEQVSIRNGGGGREKGWAAGCICHCGASAGGAAAWARHFATLAVRVTGCHAGSYCGAK